MSNKAFLSVSETARELGVSVGTVTAAIDNGKLPAIRLSDSHQSTRIPRTALFPEEQSTRDLRFERVRKQFADVLRKQEANERVCAAYLDRQGELREAIAVLADELAMQDMAAARDALQKAS